MADMNVNVLRCDKILIEKRVGAKTHSMTLDGETIVCVTSDGGEVVSEAVLDSKLLDFYGNPMAGLGQAKVGCSGVSTRKRDGSSVSIEGGVIVANNLTVTEDVNVQGSLRVEGAIIGGNDGGGAGF